MPNLNFSPTSRYYLTETSKLTDANGHEIVYLRRRFLPPTDRFVPMQWHSVAQGERIDQITAHYLNDPEQFWRVADANNAMHPDDLTRDIGHRIAITLPEGLTATLF